MSKIYEMAKAYYESGEWNEPMIRRLVEKDRLTPAEYEGITGNPYEA